MVFKVESVMLLLTISIQQLLWGILVWIPQTNATKCKPVSIQNEPAKKVQMLRRIPAQCSGWDEAWSWLSSKDCRTKYILDFVELPNVGRTSEMCENENGPLKSPPALKYDDNSAHSDAGAFDIDEKALAIAFGSVTGILLILLAIMLFFLCQKGLIRCGSWSAGSVYTTDIGFDGRDALNDNRVTCSQYADNGCVMVEPEYEEIDQLAAKKRLDLLENAKSPIYQNVHDNNELHGGIKDLFVKGSHMHHVTATPSAPYDEDLQQTNMKCRANEYKVLDERAVRPGLIVIPAVNVKNENNPTLARENTNGHKRNGDVAFETEHNEDSIVPNSIRTDCDLTKSSEAFTHVLLHPNEILDSCIQELNVRT